MQIEKNAFGAATASPANYIRHPGAAKTRVIADWSRGECLALAGLIAYITMLATAITSGAMPVSSSAQK
jgi:hypothetical protein